MSEKEEAELLEDQRRALKQSVDFFSSANKGALEKLVCTQFFANIGLEFHADEIILQTDDPPDAIFRGPHFEIKEVLDPRRRRHAAQALARLDHRSPPLNSYSRKRSLFSSCT